MKRTSRNGAVRVSARIASHENYALSSIQNNTFKKHPPQFSRAPCVAAPTRSAAGEPTDQLVKVRGIKATKKLKAGELNRRAAATIEAFEPLVAVLVMFSIFCLLKRAAFNGFLHLNVLHSTASCRQNNRPNPQSWRTLFARAAASV